MRRGLLLVHAVVWIDPRGLGPRSNCAGTITQNGDLAMGAGKMGI